MKEKLKTIIVIDNLHTGGVASSLYNYLKVAAQYMDCDLLVFNHNGIDRARIPEQVKLLDTETPLKMLGMNRKEMDAESKYLGIVRFCLFLFARLFSGQSVRKLLSIFIKKLPNKYDLAISFAQDDSWKSLSKGCNDFVLQKINADRKAVFIHCDYTNFGGYHPKQGKNFSKFTNIICVSESCCKSFISKFPLLEDKVICCENFTDVERIAEYSADAVEYAEGCYNFVSVCRLSVVKGLSRTIETFSKLVSEGFQNFTWTIVGDGPEYGNLLTQVKAIGLEQKIVFAGNQNNPYPYIKNASALLLPSLHEAAPMVYGECAALGVPIITTKTCSAVELVQDKGLGIVMENSIEGIYDGLKEVLSGNVDLRQFMMDKDVINKKAMQQFLFFTFPNS